MAPIVPVCRHIVINEPMVNSKLIGSAATAHKDGVENERFTVIPNCSQIKVYSTVPETRPRTKDMGTSPETGATAGVEYTIASVPVNFGNGLWPHCEKRVIDSVSNRDSL